MRFKKGDKVMVKGDADKTEWTVTGYHQYLKNRFYILDSGLEESLIKPAEMLQKIEVKPIGFKKAKE